MLFCLVLDHTSSFFATGQYWNLGDWTHFLSCNRNQDQLCCQSAYLSNEFEKMTFFSEILSFSIQQPIKAAQHSNVLQLCLTQNSLVIPAAEKQLVGKELFLTSCQRRISSLNAKNRASRPWTAIFIKPSFECWKRTSTSNLQLFFASFTYSCN